MVPVNKEGRSPGEPDSGTIERCRKGERAALEQVFRGQAADLRRLLGPLLGPALDLDDVLQATFVAAITAFPRFRGEASVRTWLSHIAIRIAHDQLRRPERKRRVALELVRDEPADPAPSPEAVVDHRRRLGRLYEHLDGIEVRKRIAFVLHVFEGHPLEEVASLMGATRIVTKARVFRARQALLARARKDPMLRDLFEVNR